MNALLITLGLLSNLYIANAFAAEEPPKRSEHIDELNSPDPAVRRNAAMLLGASTATDEDIVALTNFLKVETDTQARIYAAGSLAECTENPDLALAGLILALKDKDYLVRAEVARTIGRLGGDEISERKSAERFKPLVPHLSELCRSNDSDDRKEAAKALCAIGPSAFDVLREMLKSDKNPSVRTAVAEGLMRMKGEAAPLLETLISALNDSSDRVAEHAANTIAELEASEETKKAIPLLLTNLEKRPSGEYVKALAKFGKDANKAVPLFLKLLQEQKNDSVLRWYILESLATIGAPAEQAVPAILEAFQASDSYERGYAVKGLLKYGKEAKAAAKPLAEGLSKVYIIDDSMIDDSPNDIASAIVELGTDGREAKPILIDILKKNERRRWKYAVYALSGLGTEAKDTIPMLLPLIKEEEERLRATTASALGIIGQENANEVVPALIEGLMDKSNDVRNEAAWSLSEFGKKAIAAKKLLVEMATDEENKTGQVYSVHALIEMGEAEPSMIPVIVPLLRHRELRNRTLAANTLTKYAQTEKAVITALIDELKCDNALAREWAADTISKIGPEAKDAVPALVENLKHEEAGVRSWAAIALSRIGPEAKGSVADLKAALTTEKDEDTKEELQKAVAELEK